MSLGLESQCIALCNFEVRGSDGLSDVQSEATANTLRRLPA